MIFLAESVASEHHCGTGLEVRMAELAEQLKREIGQHFVFGFHGYEVSDDIRTLIRDYYLGNVILMKRNVQSISQVHDLVRQLQLIAEESGHSKPLMIGIDQENGLVSAFSSTSAGTQFPGAMALAATGSPELVEEVSAATGKEMRLAGINWAYSPVADVNSDPRNPVIGVRSFGDDPLEVARYVKAVSKGLTSAKVAPSAKHFPGHGNTHVDSHVGLPRIITSKEKLAATELVPFQALVDAGIATIMTGHMALPWVTGDDMPCSLSKVIASNLLREEMGFRGVIVTDCLEMEAVAGRYGSEGGAFFSLQAGADIIMICHRFDRQVGALNEAYAAVENSRISINALVTSSRRIGALKDAFAGTWEDVLGTLDVEQVARLKMEHKLLSRRAYAAAVSLIRDKPGVLPLSKGNSTILFTPRMESINPAVDDAEGNLRDEEGRLQNTAGPSYQAFAASVAQHAPVQHVVYAPNDEISEALKDSARSASSIIFATRNGFDRGAWQIAYLRKVVAMLSSVASSTKVVLVSTCAPYDLLTLEDVNAPCLATYEFTVPALEAATAVIFGKEVARGKVPVKKGLVQGTA
ncbi:Beta-hexosaminidase [Grifola frondosa]|uniref:Beta-hexosaminidase n=1 Tax=Grifola frondosa TaxID=5627 RepID=A0A1C7MCS8_GRIFR|nr:Beta-hexosaminidase [Grifola frondosa]